MFPTGKTAPIVIIWQHQTPVILRGRETPGTLAASLTDEERRELVLRKLKAGDVRLAAHVDPYKHEEMEGGDGR